MRLIDADALCAMLRDGTIIATKEFILSQLDTEAFARFVTDNCPTIDPVKHGRWEVDDPIEPVYSLRCSECGEEYEFDNGLFREQFYRFCPHCGTRMDGDGNDRKRI